MKAQISIHQMAEEAHLSALEFAGQTDALRSKRQPPPDEVFAIRGFRQVRKDALAEHLRAQAQAASGAEAAE